MIKEKESDKILEMFFSKQRWEYAISKGVDKDINRSHLYQLTKPETRKALCLAIKSGTYKITPPHTALIPKDTPGEFRKVYINEPVDRVILSIANDLLFDIAPDMVHHRCMAYRRGISCSSVVQDVSRRVCREDGEVIGWKSDLRKYFDSVPVEFIDRAFDAVEERHGKSALIDVLRDYYHSDWYFDTDGTLVNSYQSLKQGCSVASWLADVLLYHIDEKLSSLDGYYTRYSDDMLFVGKDYVKAMAILVEELGKMRISLHPKKVEYLSRTRWFKFLGFSIKGRDISLSATRIKTFQHEVEARTVKNPKCRSLSQAVQSVVRYLYKGNGEYSWGTQVLPVINVRHDIDTMNAFVMDCLRAVTTGKKNVGGLGFASTQENGCIVRGIGRNVTMNRKKTLKDIQGYLSLGCAHNAITTSKKVYNALVISL